MRSFEDESRREWLEADGLGGFAMGTVAGVRSRRYHAIRVTSETPPADRWVQIVGLEAWLETPAGPASLSSQWYAPGTLHPDAFSRMESFCSDPWPTWEFRIGEDRFSVEIFVPRGSPMTVVAIRALDKTLPAELPARLPARPPTPRVLRARLLHAGRDPHQLQAENQSIDFRLTVKRGALLFAPYLGQPPVRIDSNGTFHQESIWYRSFLYQQEQERGLDCLEDLASPGVFEFDLASAPAILIIDGAPETHPRQDEISPLAEYAALASLERARRAPPYRSIDLAADSYVVKRSPGETIIAGYPWFSDWGRDTFIAMRGLCIARKRFTSAENILREWAKFVNRGMLPNRFPDRVGVPEYNSVDASLWFVIAVFELRRALFQAGDEVPKMDQDPLLMAVREIINGYAQGTRFGIRMTDDGLITAGGARTQLTWMDARSRGIEITPRGGKPIEIQALWLNALRLAERLDPRYESWAARGLATLRSRFWNESRHCLYDVIDVDELPGRLDDSIRPNQLLAVGGLPFCLLDGPHARAVIDTVEQKLWTPHGMRTLDPADERYCGRYEGGAHERDAAYHQGTAWPWLLGPFIEGWVRAHGSTIEVRERARNRFFTPWKAQLDEAGLGHIFEIADGDPPHTPRGCPFQAWSLGELLRTESWLCDVGREGPP